VSQVSVFTSVWVAVLFLAGGALLATWQWVRLGGDRWGEPRVRVVALRRAGSDVRWGLLLAAWGLAVLTARLTTWTSAWWWAVVSVWAALVIWNIVAWIRSPL
jgi:hypothetical protein